MEVTLEQEELELKTNIENKLSQLRDIYHGLILPEKKTNEILNEMGTLAHSLHMKLKVRGFEPKHHSYMIKNRGLQPDHPDFYTHVHPVEDLLAFIKNQNANDDPEDQTIGDEFTLTVYSKRWVHDDTYTLKRTKNGWDVEHTHSGSCDKTGAPYILSNFDNDSVYYPTEFRGLLEWLWIKASEQGLSHQDVQNALNQLGEWIKLTTKSAPSGGFWEGY